MPRAVAVPSGVTSEAGLDFEELFRAEYARLAAALQLLTGDRMDTVRG